jgi:hypothetical protein
MPIPQSRVIDLLSAALDYKQAFYGLSYLVNARAQESNDSQLTAIARMKVNEFLKEPIKTPITIIQEQDRINRTAHYNQNRSIAKERERRAKQEEERQNSIPSLTTDEDDYVNAYMIERETQK